MEILARQCKKSSRPVDLEKDLQRVKKDAKNIFKLCVKPMGKYRCALALCHCQVNHTDPLRFFVTLDARIIINPKIRAKMENDGFTKETEGCLSYPFRDEVSVKRWAKIQVEYWEMIGDEMKLKDELIEGILARIFQHEIDHMNGKAIYFP
jgi:peptide deformylase